MKKQFLFCITIQLRGLSNGYGSTFSNNYAFRNNLKITFVQSLAKLYRSHCLISMCERVCIIQWSCDRLGGVEVERPPLVRDVMGSMVNPWPGHNKYFEHGSDGFPALDLRLVGFIASRLHGWFQDKHISNIGN